MIREKRVMVAHFDVGRTLVAFPWSGERAMIAHISFQPSTDVTIELQLHAVDLDAARVRVWSFVAGSTYESDTLVEVQSHQKPMFEIDAYKAGQISIAAVIDSEDEQPVVQLARETLAFAGTT